MEIKKSPKADLEKGKGLSLLLGLVVAVSVVYVSLEWRSASINANVNTNTLAQADIEDALIIEDQKQEEPPEEQPKPEEKIEVQLPEEIKVVDNDKKVKEMAFVSTDEDKPLPPPAPPAEEEETEEIFTIVEESCEFPGGPSALMKYLSKNIEYPEIAAENGIQGRVILSFVIERNGKPSQVKVVRGVDPALDKEAVRVVKSMPAWKPGKQQGKAVRQRFTLPVQFRLQ